MVVMGKKPMTTTKTTTITTTTTTTTKVPQISTTSKPSQIHVAQKEEDEIKLIDCIWNFFGCVKHKRKEEKVCKLDFNDCCMIVMGMPPEVTTTTTRRPISDIDLPELPDFLKPKPSTPRPQRPIQDIDLPDGASIIQPDESVEIIEQKPSKEEEEHLACLGRLYKCQEANKASCPNTQRCLPIEPVVAEVIEDDSPREPIGKSLCSEASSGGEIPQTGSILVPHPTDCSKFFSCQPIKNSNGSFSWIAHEQSCPATTGFDTNLQICNFIENLPRCLYARKL